MRGSRSALANLGKLIERIGSGAWQRLGSGLPRHAEIQPKELDAMDTLWSAVIGAGGAITAALVPAIFARQASVRNKSYDKVTGSISNPQPDETVRRTFKCAGVVTGMQPRLSLWLAVELGDLVWPKESKVAPDQDNKWSATVFEDGATETFAIDRKSTRLNSSHL